MYTLRVFRSRQIVGLRGRMRRSVWDRLLGWSGKMLLLTWWRYGAANIPGLLKQQTGMSVGLHLVPVGLSLRPWLDLPEYPETWRKAREKKEEEGGDREFTRKCLTWKGVPPAILIVLYALANVRANEATCTYSTYSIAGVSEMGRFGQAFCYLHRPNFTQPHPLNENFKHIDIDTRITKIYQFIASETLGKGHTVSHHFPSPLANSRPVLHAITNQ